MVSSNNPDRLSTEAQLLALQQAQEVMQIFLTEVSSEIRTPLTAIAGYSELMLAGEVGSLNEKQTQFLTAILKSSQNVLEVFQYLFEMHRVVSGSLFLKIEEVDLTHLLQQVKLDKIQLNIPHELPKIWADRHRLRETIRVIVAETTGPFYEVGQSHTILTIKHDNTWVTFTITTEGEGSRYFRDHPNPMIFLSRAIIEAHGGHMQIEKQGEASLGIRFTLPLNQNKPVAGEKAAVEGKKPISRSWVSKRAT